MRIVLHSKISHEIEIKRLTYDKGFYLIPQDFGIHHKWSGNTDTNFYSSGWAFRFKWALFSFKFLFRFGLNRPNK